MMTWILCIIGAYLAGSIPFGYLIAKARGMDIRAHGSGNIGATNVSRVLGKKLGLLCLVLDLGKGAGPTLIAGFQAGVINQSASALDQSEMWLWMAVAIASVLGHMFSVFLKFTGGKGVATGFGALVAMWSLMTLPALLALVVWYFLLRMTKYVAVASMGAVLSIPLGYLLASIPSDGQNVLPALLHACPPLIVTGVLAILIVVKHRGNISRIRKGEEPKVAGRARRGDHLHHPTDSQPPS